MATTSSVSVVHDEVGARKPGLLGLGRRTDGRDHLGAAPFGELHGIVTDGAGAAGDEYRLSHDRAVAIEAGPRGHGGDAERGAFRKRQIVRQRRHQMFGERNVFSRRAERAAVALAVEQPDALAGLEPRDAVADLVDDARAVAVRNDARIFHRAIAAAAAADIGGIDAGRLQPHPDFARAGHRRRHLAIGQHLGRGARSLVPDRLHSVPGNAPPSSRMFWPVMKPDLAPHRKAQACPNSSGSPKRPAGLSLARSASS